MIFCHDCKQGFDEEDAKIVEDRVGEYMGVPAYNHFMVCPYCGSCRIEEYTRSELDKLLYGEEEMEETA